MAKEIKKTVKVYKQRALVMTIPVAFLQVLGISLGSKLDLVYDDRRHAMIVTKAKDEEETNGDDE